MSEIILATVTALIGLGTVFVLILRYSRREVMASASDDLQSIAKRLKCDTSPDRMKQCSPPRQLSAEGEQNVGRSGDGPSTSGGLASSKRETPVSISSCSSSSSFDIWPFTELSF